MAKPKVNRIYEANPTLPMDWGFPVLMVVTKTMSKLWVAVVQPITWKGELDGMAMPLEIKLIEEHYHLMHIRKARDVLPHENGEACLG